MKKLKLKRKILNSGSTTRINAIRNASDQEQKNITCPPNKKPKHSVSLQVISQMKTPQNGEILKQMAKTSKSPDI